MLRRRKKETTVVPEPDVLKTIGEESRRKGTDKLTSGKINQIIKAARVKK